MSFVFRAQNPDNPGEWFEVGFYPPILEERYGVFINVGTYKEIEEAEDAVHYLNGGGGRRETELVRNRPGGSAVITRVAVRWRYRIRADAQVTDYDAALTAERTLATAAVSDPTGTDVRWILTTLTRTLQSDGEASFVAGLINIDAFHQLDLE